jgi:hypothetical protein
MLGILLSLKSRLCVKGLFATTALLSKLSKGSLKNHKKTLAISLSYSNSNILEFVEKR